MAEDLKEKQPRMGRSVLVWLSVFVLLGSLLLFRGFSPRKVAEFDQTRFETELAAGRIRTAVVVAKGSDVLEISGQYLPEAAPGETAEPAPYTTRVLHSPRLSELLEKTKVSVDSGNDNWWALAISILPDRKSVV